MAPPKITPPATGATPPADSTPAPEAKKPTNENSSAVTFKSAATKKDAQKPNGHANSYYVGVYLGVEGGGQITNLGFDTTLAVPKILVELGGEAGFRVGDSNTFGGVRLGGYFEHLFPTTKRPGDVLPGNRTDGDIPAPTGLVDPTTGDPAKPEDFNNTGEDYKWGRTGGGARLSGHFTLLSESGWGGYARAGFGVGGGSYVSDAAVPLDETWGERVLPKDYLKLEVPFGAGIAYDTGNWMFRFGYAGALEWIKTDYTVPNVPGNPESVTNFGHSHGANAEVVLHTEIDLTTCGVCETPEALEKEKARWIEATFKNPKNLNEGPKDEVVNALSDLNLTDELIKEHGITKEQLLSSLRVEIKVIPKFKDGKIVPNEAQQAVVYTLEAGGERYVVMNQDLLKKGSGDLVPMSPDYLTDPENQRLKQEVVPGVTVGSLEKYKPEAFLYNTLYPIKPDGRYPKTADATVRKLEAIDNLDDFEAAVKQKKLFADYDAAKENIEYLTPLLKKLVEADPENNAIILDSFRDHRGPDKLNEVLSQMAGRVIRKWLELKGVKVDRVVDHGEGAKEGVQRPCPDTNGDAECLAQNRSIHFRLKTKDGVSKTIEIKAEEKKADETKTVNVSNINEMVILMKVNYKSMNACGALGLGAAFMQLDGNKPANFKDGSTEISGLECNLVDAAEMTPAEEVKTKPNFAQELTDTQNKLGAIETMANSTDEVKLETVEKALADLTSLKAKIGTLSKQADEAQPADLAGIPEGKEGIKKQTAEFSKKIDELTKKLEAKKAALSISLKTKTIAAPKSSGTASIEINKGKPENPTFKVISGSVEIVSAKVEGNVIKIEYKGLSAGKPAVIELEGTSEKITLENTSHTRRHRPARTNRGTRRPSGGGNPLH